MDRRGPKIPAATLGRHPRRDPSGPGYDEAPTMRGLSRAADAVGARGPTAPGRRCQTTACASSPRRYFSTITDSGVARIFEPCPAQPNSR